MKPIDFLKRKTGALWDRDLFEHLARPGMHERHIAQIFGGQLRFEGAEQVFPRRLVIMAFTNRSGSNLMAEYVRQAGLVGGMGEFLNHDTVARRSAERQITSFPDYIRDLHRQYCPAPKTLGLKASWDQIAMLLRWNITAMFPRVTVLHVVRNDVVAQAVSYGIALQTDAWTSKHEIRDIEPQLDPDQVARSVAKFHRANLLIRLLTDAHGIKRHDVSYEQIVTDPQVSVVRVLRAAELAGTRWTPHTPSLTKQADDRNSAFAQAFHAKVRSLL